MGSPLLLARVNSIDTTKKVLEELINNLKTMDGEHAVHERQAILSTTVVISHTFCMAKENELTPRGAWQ